MLDVSTAEKKDILSLELPQLKQVLEVYGEKGFRAKQIFEWLHKRRVMSFDDMTNISLELRKSFRSGFILRISTQSGV